MSNYIENMRNAMRAYHAKVKEVDTRVNNTRNDYGEEAAQRERARQQAALDSARTEAQRTIRAAYDAGMSDAKKWGTLDGNNITSDAKLLDAGMVDVYQYEAMKDKYHDNYTMLEALRKYGDARNDEYRKKAHDAGNHILMGGPYNTNDIPTVERKGETWGHLRDGALNMLDIIDGSTGDRWTRALHEETGFSSIERFGEGVDV